VYIVNAYDLGVDTTLRYNENLFPSSSTSSSGYNISANILGALLGFIVSSGYAFLEWGRKHAIKGINEDIIKDESKLNVIISELSSGIELITKEIATGGFDPSTHLKHVGKIKVGDTLILSEGDYTEEELEGEKQKLQEQIKMYQTKRQYLEDVQKNKLVEQLYGS